MGTKVVKELNSGRRDNSSCTPSAQVQIRARAQGVSVMEFTEECDQACRCMGWGERRKTIQGSHRDTNARIQVQSGFFRHRIGRYHFSSGVAMSSAVLPPAAPPPFKDRRGWLTAVGIAEILIGCLIVLFMCFAIF